MDTTAFHAQVAGSQLVQKSDTAEVMAGTSSGHVECCIHGNSDKCRHGHEPLGKICYPADDHLEEGAACTNDNTPYMQCCLPSDMGT